MQVPAAKKRKASSDEEPLTPRTPSPGMEQLPGKRQRRSPGHLDDYITCPPLQYQPASPRVQELPTKRSRSSPKSLNIYVTC